MSDGSAQRPHNSAVNCTSEATNAAVNPEKKTICEWKGCGAAFEVAEDLYRHLCDEHVGRNSTNNLCLTCHWGNCTASYGKRDHITSHIRIHIAMKPFACQQCGKTFKRPQDLKKHGRTHAAPSETGSCSPRTTAETADDDQNREPALDCRSRPRLSPSGIYPRITTSATSPFSVKSPNISGPYNYPALSPNTSPLSLSGATYSSPSSSAASETTMTSPMASGGLLNAWNYPSMIRERPGHRSPDHFDLEAKYAQRMDIPQVSGVKRSRATVDQFFEDVQRKRVAPVYNSGMVERLDMLSSTLDNGCDLDGSFGALTTGFPGAERPGSLQPDFNPTRAPRLSLGNSIADINLWLVQLGNSVLRDKPESGGELNGSQPAFDAPEFDFTQTLNQYDLGNIPGIEGLGIGAGATGLPMHSMSVPQTQPGVASPMGYGLMGQAQVPHVTGTVDGYAHRGYDAPLYPQLAPPDKGVHHSFRRVELLTRAPSQGRSSASAERDGESMDVDGEDEKPHHAPPVDPTRGRHLNVIINMLIALNKGRRSAPVSHTERRPSSHIYPTLTFPSRDSDTVSMRASRSWQAMRHKSGDSFRASESRQTLRPPIHASHRQSDSESGHEKAENSRSLPSIAELLSDDM